MRPYDVKSSYEKVDSFNVEKNINVALNKIIRIINFPLFLCVCVKYVYLFA